MRMPTFPSSTNLVAHLALATLAPCALFAAATTQPLVPADPSHAKSALFSAVSLQDAIRDRHQLEASAKSVGPVHLEDVAEISNMDGALRVLVHPPAEVLNIVETGRLVILDIERTEGLWTISRTLPEQEKGAPPPEPTWTLSRYDHDQRTVEGGFWEVHLIVASTTITVQSECNNGNIVRYTQDPKSARLLVTQAGQPGVDTEATSLIALQKKSGDSLAVYLGPMLRRLTGEDLLGPGAADVYRVFDEIKPAPAAVTQLEKTLDELESPEDAARTAATNRLLASGPAGVLAGLRMNQENLGAQQRINLAALIGRHRHLPTLDPTAAKHDPAFLAECLVFDDSEVRKAAKRAMEGQLGHPIEIDLDGSYEGRVAAIKALLREINKTSTTKPS